MVRVGFGQSRTRNLQRRMEATIHWTHSMYCQIAPGEAQEAKTRISSRRNVSERKWGNHGLAKSDWILLVLLFVGHGCASDTSRKRVVFVLARRREHYAFVVNHHRPETFLLSLTRNSFLLLEATKLKLLFSSRRRMLD